MKFSVLMSVYTKEDPIFFKDALKSLMIQTKPPTEIVLVKDGPLTKDLDHVIDSFIMEYDPNRQVLKLIELEKNGGLGNALRVGVLQCSYEYIVRMDSNDICHEERFEKQIKFMVNNPNVDVLGTT